jgi:hypothetical protein
MSQGNLDDLERDVEDARIRLLHDVGRLRAPATLSGFKDDVVAKAQEVRDDWVHKATDAASSSVQRTWSDLVDKASANPGAALVIGAGLVWRLAHRPPIATLLVGVGLAGLLRTNPSSSPSPIITRAAERGGTARNWGGAVNETVREWAEETRDAAGVTLSRVSKSAFETYSLVSTTAADVTGQASEIAETVSRNGDARDACLLGAAILAIGAASVIAFQRQDD